jgi:hypothetical protein
MVMSSSMRRLDDVLLRMGSKEVEEAETKLLHLFAKHLSFALHHQVFLPDGKTLLCIPLVQGLYPAAMNCCTFSHLYVCWWFNFLKGQVRDVWPFSTLKPHKKHTFQQLYHLYTLEKSRFEVCCCTTGGTMSSP